MKKEISDFRAAFDPLTFYQKFEQLCVLALTGLIAVIIVFSLWHLALNIFLSVLNNSFDPTNYEVFQTVFGMIFTVIIALEFKRSLLVLPERHDGIIQVRTVILIALLAVVRKLIILDVAHTESLHLIALAAAILALGAVYWLVSNLEKPKRSTTALDRDPTQ